jgi:hypothetical protein
VRLSGIAAIAANNVWVVGSVNSTGGRSGLPFIEHYDGASWCAVDSHNWSGGPLYALAATSKGDAWAVGDQIEHWNGAAWTVVASPSPGAVPIPLPPGVPPRSIPAHFNAVSASATDNAWAMSSDGRVVVHWDGTRWIAMQLPAAVARITTPTLTGPHADLQNPRLEALATLSFTDTWVVGESGPDSEYPWAMDWNGKQWQEMTLPRSPAPASYPAALRSTCEVTDYLYPQDSFTALAAVRHGDVWAFGGQAPGGDMPGPPGSGTCPLAFHWDGARWQEEWPVTSPHDVRLLVQTNTTPGAYAWALQMATVTPEGDIWAVTDPQLWALHWAGHRWHVVAAFSGPRSTESHELTGMSASSDSDVWAVALTVPPDWNLLHWDGRQWRGVLALPVG